MIEREKAIQLANKVLDTPYIDPDGDLCVLARHFLRSEERVAKVLELAHKVAKDVGGEFADTHLLNTGLNLFVAELTAPPAGQGREK